MLVTDVSLFSSRIDNQLTGEDDGDNGYETEDHGDGSESTRQSLYVAAKETYAV
jgi:hypothetical protein